MSTRVLWFVLGALGAFVFLKRKELMAIVENRRTISAGGQVVEGAQSLYAGGKTLLGELFD